MRRVGRRPRAGLFRALRAPALQVAGLLVLTARTAGRTRLPQRRLLPRRTALRTFWLAVAFLAWWCVFLRPLPQRCNALPRRVKKDPLLGGGNTAHRRRRPDISRQVQQLSTTVDRLAAAVRDLQQERGRHDRRRRPKPIKPKISTSRFNNNKPSPAPVPDPPPESRSLWERLQPFLAMAEAAEVPPSDAAIRGALLPVLKPESRPDSRTWAPKPKPRPNKPKPQQSHFQPANAPQAEREPKPKGPPTFAQLVKGSAPAKTEVKSPKPQLVQHGWDAKCRFVSAKTLHSLPDEPGPLVVIVHTDSELQEVRDWAAASNPARPVSCVDFCTMDCPQDVERCDVLVRFPSSPAIVARKAALHLITKHGPKPFSLKPTEKFQDEQRSSDKNQPETAILRLTLAKEYADPTRFGEAQKSPQTLPALLVPGRVGKILRTFAVATYEGEITCLLSVKASDVDGFLKDARTLCPGGFLAPQRTATATVQWISRDPKQSPTQYLAKAREAAEGVHGAYLAYRPGGRANIGLRAATPQKGITGAIAPRWTLAGAPKTWLEEDTKEWLQKHGFKEAQQVRRSSAETWFFRAWPEEGAGAAVYASGLVVAPAAAQHRKVRSQASSTAAPVWGARLVQRKDSEPQHPVIEATVPHDASSMEISVPATEIDASQDARDRSRSRERKKNAAEAASNPTPAVSKPLAGPKPAMPHARLYNPQECGGEGDCAYTSLATAMAEFSKSKPEAKDLRPKGKLQAFLRCEAAKYIRANPQMFQHLDPKVDGTPEMLATKIARSGTWADSISLFALAHKIGVLLRIWAFDKNQQVWKLYLVGPEPEGATTKKQKKTGSHPTVVWLKLEDSEAGGQRLAYG